MATLDDLVARTQQDLGSVITSPPLAPKLLSRPPFRFLHAVISSCIEECGFAEGLFDGDELDAELITGKDAKLAYLEKIIRFVEDATGEQLSVDAASVVKGEDAEQTNLFLHALARGAADSKEQQRRAALEGIRTMSASGARDDDADDAAAAKRMNRHATAMPRLEAKESLDDLVATTQQVLGAVIREPELTRTLLRRPPFAFMHEVVSSVTRATGFGEGLYDGDDLSTENWKSRGATERVGYISKIVKLVEETLKEPLTITPEKVHSARGNAARDLGVLGVGVGVRACMGVRGCAAASS
jgi:hypothetical protein